MKDDKKSFGYDLLTLKNEEMQVINNIPRFVDLENYTDSFGLQWQKFNQTQLDSYTSTSISYHRCKRLVGGTLDILKNKTVLEAGCGAGRFTEILLNAEANVFSVDMSSAVEANYTNFKDRENHFVCQASILDIPVSKESFDIVFCVGVVQHTPNPEETMRILCSHIKPGGLLIMDHYSHDYPDPLSRRILRSFLLKRSSQFSLTFCIILTSILWQIHRLLWFTSRYGRIFRGIRRRFLKLSPIVDYHDAYPELGSRLLREWAILDTHDTLTDVYKHFRSAEEIDTHLNSLGMILKNSINSSGNGVEIIAEKPTE